MATGNPPPHDPHGSGRPAGPRRRSVLPDDGRRPTTRSGPAVRGTSGGSGTAGGAGRSTQARTARPAAATARPAAATHGAAAGGAARRSAGRGGRGGLVDYPRRGRRGIGRWIPSWRLVLGTFLTVLAVLVGGVLVAYALTPIPSPDDFVDAQTTTVYYADGETEMGTFGVQNRVLVPGDAIPQHVKDAVVAAEDRTFYENAGISPTGIARALWNNIRGGSQQGGSTITQQYAERYYIGSTVSDYRGKAREALLAVKLDQAQDKDEILGNYLNTIFFGRGSYGIETAAQSYFGVSSAELSLSQAALLAGVIPSPNNWDPRVDRERAEERWNYVLDGMVTIGRLDPAERAAQTFPETIEYTRADTYAGPQGYLLDMVRRELLERSSITEEELDATGYRIVTTVEADMQQAAVETVATLPEDRPENLRVALVTLEPASGAIRALYGGPDFLTVSRNAVTQDVAQAGSTFKPFTLVGFLEQGNSLRSRYSGRSGLEVEGFPDGIRNFGDQSFGEIDVVRATADSVNSVYAQMNAEIGPETTLRVAERAGVPEDALGMEAVPANVLGTASPNPLDMAQAFNTFAAQGVRTQPYIVESVEELGGGTVYRGAQPGERMFAENIMADTTYALTQVVERGSGTAARALGRPVAGKTGTSNENRSAWFVGYTPQLTTAVALYQVGPENEAQPITPFGGRSQITGGSFPAQLWTTFMSRALEGTEELDFPDRADVGEPNVPPVVEVPSVVGLPEAEATAQLRASGFGVAVSTDTSADVPEGLVVSQSPSGEAEQGSTVSIVVSSGPGLVDVPTVTGLGQAAARAALEGAGFTVAVREQESSQPAGTVLSREPGGAQAEPGSTVTIVVSSGPAEDDDEEGPVPTPTATPGGGAGASQPGGGGGTGATPRPSPTP